MSEHWAESANCLGRETEMFPTKLKDTSYIPGALAICAACAVIGQCREYALGFPIGEMQGVWAGMTSRQLARAARESP